MKARILFHGAAMVVLVVAVVAAAQAPSTPKKAADAPPASQSGNRQSSAPSISEREAQSGMASGRKSGSVIVLDREAQGGMASGRRQHQPILKAADANAADADKSLSSAHATESMNAAQPSADAKDKMENAASNPLYKDNTASGNNPLYEPKDKQAAPKPATSHETVEYKDPEDMTTRYRPGNNKTTSVKPAGSAPASH